jgi:serine/threonine protein kinase
METGARQRFGRYETLFRIAGGGMAEVFVARALGEGGFQKIVALKRMRPELAEDARFVTMFLDEGRLAANIASPHVVSTLDLGRAEDNSLYLVLELVTGTSLQAIMFADDNNTPHDEPIPIAIAVELLAQAAQGLHDAHEATSPAGEPLDIVHRDCSPHNILVDVKGQVKITDFGIAKAMERQTQSHAGEMKGKLAYLSPEQARGLPVDRRVDIFILGIVAWEMFSGRQLFEAEHPVEALHKVTTMPIPPLTDLRPDIPRAVADAVAQALERDPDVRFSTAAAFGNALLNALGNHPGQRAQIGALVRKRGGDGLARLERGIRDAMGKKADSVPPPSSVEAMISPPSTAPGSMSAPRQRKRTMGMGSPSSSPPPAMKTRPHGGPDSIAPAPVTSPLGMMDTQLTPLGIEPAESSEQPIPLTPRTEGRHATVALPGGPALPANTAFPEPEQKGSLGIKIAAGAALLLMAGTAGVLGAWYSETQPTARPVAPIDEPAPVAPELVQVEEPEVAAPAIAAPPPSDPPVVEVVEAEPPAPRPRATTKVRRIPPREQPEVVRDEAPSAVGDRAEAFDEIFRQPRP